VLGIVGESGSGKSVAMYSMLGLVRDANVSISGSVRFEGREILGLSDTEMQSVRGGEVGMIFQDPMTALTPVYTVGWQIVEQLRAHNDMTKKAATFARPSCSPRSASLTQEPCQSLPSRILWRHAPARRHRHGPLVQSETAYR